MASQQPKRLRLQAGSAEAASERGTEHSGVLQQNVARPRPASVGRPGSDASLAAQVIQSVKPDSHADADQQEGDASHVDPHAMQELQLLPLSSVQQSLRRREPWLQPNQQAGAGLPGDQAPEPVPSLLSGLNLQPGTDPRILRTWSWLIQSAPTDAPGPAGPEETGERLAAHSSEEPMAAPEEEQQQPRQVIAAGTLPLVPLPPPPPPSPLVDTEATFGTRVAAHTAAVMTDAQPLRAPFPVWAGSGGPLHAAPPRGPSAPRSDKQQHRRDVHREVKDVHAAPQAPSSHPATRTASQPMENTAVADQDESTLSYPLSPGLNPTARGSFRRPASARSWASGLSTPFSMETITLLAIPADSVIGDEASQVAQLQQQRWHSQPSIRHPFTSAPPSAHVHAPPNTSMASGPLLGTQHELRPESLDGRPVFTRTALSTPPGTSPSVHQSLTAAPLAAQPAGHSRYAPMSSSTSGTLTQRLHSSSTTDAVTHHEQGSMYSSNVPSAAVPSDQHPRANWLVIQRGLHAVHVGPTHSTELSSQRPYLPNVLASLEEEDTASTNRLHASAGASKQESRQAISPLVAAAMRAYAHPRPYSQPAPSRNVQRQLPRFLSAETAAQQSVSSVPPAPSRSRTTSPNIQSSHVQQATPPGDTQDVTNLTQPDGLMPTKPESTVASMRTGAPTFSLTGALSLYRQNKSNPPATRGSAPDTGQTSGSGTGQVSGSGPDTGLMSTMSEEQQPSYSRKSTPQGTALPVQLLTSPTRFKPTVGADSPSTFGRFGTGPGTPASASTVTTAVAVPDRSVLGPSTPCAEPLPQPAAQQLESTYPGHLHDLITSPTEESDLADSSDEALARQHNQDTREGSVDLGEPPQVQPGGCLVQLFACFGKNPPRAQSRR